MRRRWSDAQYTGRYLRRTIVHGKGEHRPDRYGGSGGTESEKMPALGALGWIMIIAVIVGLIVLRIVSTPLFCIAMVILIFLVMALT